ncbi:MAG TPA: HlyC/CorC family transporter [Syntrophaceae bacterium]|nr:HlyC/CorC family transporter [Syntrophaceae bacterium]
MKTEHRSDKGSLKGLFSWLRGKGRKGVPSDIEAAIHQLIDVGEEKGVIHEDEGEMIQSIFEFRDTAAKEIMVPRTDMVAIDSKAPISQVIQLIVDKRYSRIPVYENDLDHILGILHVKDLLRYWGNLDISLDQIMRPPFFIPETKKVGDLLKDLRNNKSSIAIILDEYGGTSGLVTIEDIVEEIVGEIQDEHDIEEQRIIEVDANTVVADGRVDVEELEHHFDVEIPQGRFESVGGFITHILGKVPKVNETIRFRNLEFTIESADERRIKRVRIKRNLGR